MLTAEDFAKAAQELGCSIGAIKAVAEVEALGQGFLPDGQPKILFEAHIFGRRTGYKFNKTHPAISSSKWDKKLYKGGAAEHDRLALAVSLDRDAALQSASWGRFQIMGFNYRRAGFDTLQAFITAMYSGEAAHLRAFVAIVKSFGLADELQRLDAEGFAEGYNGAGYKANKYDEKIAKAFEKYGA